MNYIQTPVSQELGQFINDLAEKRDVDLGDITLWAVLQGLYTQAVHQGEWPLVALVERDFEDYAKRVGIEPEYEDLYTHEVVTPLTH